MSKSMIIGCGVAVTMFAVLVIFAFVIMGWFNTENGLHVRYEAQTKEVETTMDNMRKTLMSQYQVNKDFADTFIKCVAMQAEGRKGGSLFKMVTEASGNAIQGFTPELTSKMMNSIDGKMSEFKKSQDLWNDVWREHKTYCKTYPQAFLLSEKVMPQPEMITPTVSKEAMKSGVLDDDILGRKQAQAEK